MIKILTLFIISVLPVFIIGMYIYKKDKQKEPTKLLVKLFIGGILSCFLTIIITLLVEIMFPILTDTQPKNLILLLFQAFIGVALIEEFSKWVNTYVIAYHNKAFDELYDAILYCVFVSLGFACFENILYVFSSGISTGLVRAVTAVPGHACDGIIMGYYFGLAKYYDLHNNKSLKKRYLIFSILFPTITHGIYDYCLLTERFYFIFVFLIFVIAIYVYVIIKVKKISSINRKMKYKDNYCTNCGKVVDSDYCTNCGKHNE